MISSLGRLLIALLFLSSYQVFSQSKNKIKIGNINPGELDYTSFSIDSETEVKIVCNAGYFEQNNYGDLIFYGWILESKTRNVVWHLLEEIDYEEHNGLFTYEDEVILPAGIYEVYFSSNNSYKDEINSVGEFFNRIFGGPNRNFKRKYRSQLGLNVETKDNVLSIVDIKEAIKQFNQDAVISFTRVGNNAEKEDSFSLKDKTRIRIYSVGEGREMNLYDFGWIYDVKHNTIVWKPDLRWATYAGGGDKNYSIDEVIELNAGSYVVHYNTDDSHSFDEWNVLPPDDPQFWGISIWPETDQDAKNIMTFDDTDIVKPIVELIKLHNNEYVSQGFILKEDSDVRILCLGEGYSINNLVDHGWIINADTRKVVWEMQYNMNIEHAGGADKNRMVNEIISLPKGHYIVYYSTDDSHAYNSWNSNPPYDKKRWGITIWPTDNKVTFELFSENEYKNENIIAEIVRVRNNREYSEDFKLEKDTKIRIYAIGEGSRSRMSDFGWIEDEGGKIVWDMTYRKTEHAGGASKNRLFNDTIILEAGKYTVFYETDGSHTYKSWNSQPPFNQERYGITISLEK